MRDLLRCGLSPSSRCDLLGFERDRLGPLPRSDLYDDCPWAGPAAMRASANARPATVWTLSLVTVRSPRVRARSSGATPTLLDGRIGPARRVGTPGFGRPGPEHKSAGRELP